MSGHGVLVLVVGVVLVLLGAFVTWTATKTGREFNSTHDRFLRPAPRVSDTQQKLTVVLAAILGPLMIIGGTACVAGAHFVR